MDYVSKVILEVLEERFKDDKAYLSEKKQALETNENKFDGLSYLFFKCDSETQEKVTHKLANNGGWREGRDYDDVETMLHYTREFLKMI